MATFSTLIRRGTRGAQPAASAVSVGTLYFVTDELVTERSNGTSWEGFSDAGSGSAPTTAQYWTGASDATLSAEKNLGALGTGLVINTSGVPSIYAGASATTGSYVTAIDASGATTKSNLGISRYVVKASDESVTSSTTMQDDDDLSFTVSSGETWEVEFVLFVNAATGGDIKAQVVTPASSTVKLGLDAVLFSTGTTFGDVDRFSASSGSEPNAYQGAGGGASDNMMRLQGLVTTTNSGTIKLQWAQNASSGTATIVRAKSYVRYTRVA